MTKLYRNATHEPGARTAPAAIGARTPPRGAGAAIQRVDAAARARLRILETTDIHAHVHPYDYFADRDSDTVGLARVATLIDECRGDAPNCLLFDNGDFLQGNPLGDYAARHAGERAGRPHPVIAAMNAIGYDAATLGNHEFNYGLDFLLTALSGAGFPLVSANLGHAAPRSGKPLLPPFIMLERGLLCDDGRTHPIRIAVTGFAPPQVTTWDRQILNGALASRPIVESARALVPELQGEGADLVVALCHSGIVSPGSRGERENAALALADVDGIDIILAGHQHLTFPSESYAGIPAVDTRAGTLRGKPAVMAGAFGSHLGVIDLELENGPGGWRIAAHRSGLRPVSERRGSGSARPLVNSAPAVIDATLPDHAAALRHARRPVGESRSPLHSYFALLGHDPATGFVNTAQRWFVRDALRSGPLARLPLLSAAAPFRTGGRGGPENFTEVPAGGIALRNLADLYHFPNTVCAVRLSGAQLRDWLERSASVFNRLPAEGRDTPLISAGMPGYNFDVVQGLSYEIDITRPPRFQSDGTLADPSARRIAALRHEGRPVREDQEFIVATNSYRAAGGGGFPFAAEWEVVLESPVANRDVLADYLARRGTLRTGTGRAWSFAPMPGRTALFETAPRARRFLGTADIPEMEDLGDGTDGFARFRLRF